MLHQFMLHQFILPPLKWQFIIEIVLDTEAPSPSHLFIFRDGIGMDGDLVDLYVVQRLVATVDWLPLHQVQGLKAVDYLHWFVYVPSRRQCRSC